MAGNWRLLTSIVIGTVLAAAILSATAIYSDAIRDLGLDFAIEKEDISVRRRDSLQKLSGYQIRVIRSFTVALAAPPILRPKMIKFS